jgi:hypothetical protein
MQRFDRFLFGTLALLGIVAIAEPALADNVTGAYTCRTNTNLTLKLQLVQTESTVTGQYIVDGSHTVGHLRGTMNDNFVLNFTWQERESEALNEKDDDGWGVMSFPRQGGANAAWGRGNDRQSLGEWYCTNA